MRNTNKVTTYLSRESRDTLLAKHCGSERVREAPFKEAAQQEPNNPNLFTAHKDPIVSRKACVSSEMARRGVKKRRISAQWEKKEEEEENMDVRGKEEGIVDDLERTK